MQLAFVLGAGALLLANARLVHAHVAIVPHGCADHVAHAIDDVDSAVHLALMAAPVGMLQGEKAIGIDAGLDHHGEQERGSQVFPGAAPNQAGEYGWPSMDMAALRRHMASVRSLCDEVGRPFDEVAEVYQCELFSVLAQASVADYLPVLVAKRVRLLYQRRVQARARRSLRAAVVGALAHHCPCH